MNAAEAKIVADYLAGNFEYEMQTTLRVLAAVPSTKLDYTPDPRSYTGLRLVRHITLEDEWILNGIAEGNFGQPPDDSDACGIMSPEDAVARYKERLPAALNRVRAMSGEHLMRKIDMLGAIQLTGLDFLALGLKHSVHHRGQLSSYIRPMGGKVPGIFGPSADTEAAAAQNA